jgi:hypothetical protein
MALVADMPSAHRAASSPARSAYAERDPVRNRLVRGAGLRKGARMDPPTRPDPLSVGSSPTSCTHNHRPWDSAPLERFQDACVSYFDRDEAHVVILRGVLDWRAEAFVGTLIDDARATGRPLVVDLSAVTHLHVDVLAQLLAARQHPGSACSARSPTPS